MVSKFSSIIANNSINFTHEDLLRFLNLPNTPMPSSNWKHELEKRGITVEDAISREDGLKVLKNFRKGNKN